MADPYASEGLLHTETVRGTVTYRRYRAPGRYSSWAKELVRWRVVITRRRLVVLRRGGPMIDIDWGHPLVAALDCSVDGRNLLIRFDAAVFRADSRGTVEVRARCADPDAVLALIRDRRMGEDHPVNPTSLRSLLFVPGGRADMIAKVGRSRADGVVLDLEDAVATADKDTARATVVAALATLDVPDGTVVLVRVNAPGSPWFADDVAAVTGTRADGVVLPKLERTDQLAELQGRQWSIVGGLETALGVADARPLLAAGASMGLVGAYFGAEDFIADMGGRRTADGTEVLYARSQVALAARLAGVSALDQVVTAVHDDDAFRADAGQARALGYPGKLCIHPAQVALTHEIFTPSEAEVTHARRVLEASEKGVGLLDGEMVDDVHVRMARATLARAHSIG